MLIPKPISISYLPESLSSHYAAQFSKNPVPMVPLAQHSYPQVHVVRTPIQRLQLADQLRFPLGNDLLKAVNRFQPVGPPGFVVTRQSVVPSPLDVQRVQVQPQLGLEVLEQEVPHVVDHLLVPLLHEGFARASEDVAFQLPGHFLGVEEQILEGVVSGHFSLLVESLEVAHESSMGDSEGCSRKLGFDVRLHRRVIAHICPNQLVELLPPDVQGQILIEGDLLEQANHHIPGHLINLFILQKGIRPLDLIAESVVFFHENRMERSKNQVLIGPFISS